MTTAHRFLAVLPETATDFSDEKIDRILRKSLDVPVDANPLIDILEAMPGGVLSMINDVRVRRTLRNEGFMALDASDRKKLYEANQTLLVAVLRRMLKSGRFRENSLPIQYINEGDARLKHLRCSEGRFFVDRLYAAHPYVSDVYISFADFHGFLLDEKRSEFVRLARCLGARSVRLLHHDEDGAEGRVKVGVADVGGVEAGGMRKTSNRFDLSATYEQPGTSAPRLPDQLTWYHHEPLWQEMAAGRLESGLSTFKVTFSYAKDFGVNAGLVGMVEEMGLDIGGSFNSAQRLKQQYELTFWPKR